MTAIESNRLDKMEEKLDQALIKVDKVLSALTGDDLQIDKGLIAEHKDIRDRVTKLEGLKNMIIWISVGAGIAGGLSINKLIEWIQIAGK